MSCFFKFLSGLSACRRYFRRPLFALFYPCAVRSIAVFGIAGILCQQFAWDIGTFSAVYNALVLTAYSYGTFSVERVTVCFNAASAAAAFLVLAARAVKSAAGVNCFFHNCYLHDFYWHIAAVLP